jgi:hypothetical protein
MLTKRMRETNAPFKVFRALLRPIFPRPFTPHFPNLGQEKVSHRLMLQD